MLSATCTVTSRLLTAPRMDFETTTSTPEELDNQVGIGAKSGAPANPLTSRVDEGAMLNVRLPRWLALSSGLCAGTCTRAAGRGVPGAIPRYTARRPFM